MLAVMLALTALMLAAAPAMAQGNNNNSVKEERGETPRQQAQEERNFNNFDRNDGFVVFDNDFGDRDDFFDRNDNFIFCESGVFDDFGNCVFFPNNFERFPGVFQGIDNEAESGNVSISANVVQTGNNSNQCVTPLQFGNTGNFQNAQGFTSFGTPFNNNDINSGFFDDFGVFHPFFDGFGNDVELEGGTFTFAPVLSASCNQVVQQSAAATAN